MTAGAVVSGAYFGDKMSPLSDTTNLAPAVAGSTLFDHIKHMIYTTGPSLVIALVVYLVIGFTRGGGSANMDTVNEILGFITDNFNVGILYQPCPLRHRKRCHLSQRERPKKAAAFFLRHAGHDEHHFPDSLRHGIRRHCRLYRYHGHLG